MSTTANRPNKIHEGRNVKRFREILGVKQEALAIELGEEWNQKRISLLESKEKIEEEVLEEIAKALKVPVAAIKNFDEQKTMMYIQNNYEGSNHSAGSVFSAGDATNNACTFNPLDKLMETVDDLKALHAENKNLYERLLQSEREKIELLKSKQ